MLSRLMWEDFPLRKRSYSICEGIVVRFSGIGSQGKTLIFLDLVQRIIDFVSAIRFEERVHVLKFVWDSQSNTEESRELFRLHRMIGIDR